VNLSRGLKLVLACIAAMLLQACGERSEPPQVEPDEPTRVLVVRLHGYVGCGVDADLISQGISEELARVHEPIDAVVFWIDSGGGMLTWCTSGSDRAGGSWRG